MFCSKCGKEISNDAKFCSGCGAKTSTETRSFEIKSINLNEWKGFGDKLQTSGFQRGMQALENCKLIFFGAVISLIISLFFLGAEMFEVTYEAFWSTGTERFTMFEDKEFLKVIVILAYIAAAVIMLLPLATGQNWENKNFYLALGTPAIAVVVMLAGMASAKNGMSTNELMQAVDATVKLSANGWLFIIINAASIILTIKSILTIAENQEEMPAVQEKIPERPYWCAVCGTEGPFEAGCTNCGSESVVYAKEDVLR